MSYRAAKANQKRSARAERRGVNLAVHRQGGNHFLHRGGVGTPGSQTRMVSPEAYHEAKRRGAQVISRPGTNDRRAKARAAAHRGLARARARHSQQKTG